MRNEIRDDPGPHARGHWRPTWRMPTFPSLKAWHWPRTHRARALACAGVLACSVLGASLVRVAMLEGTADPNRGTEVSSAANADAATESARRQAQSRDGAALRRSPAQARTRIWLQAAVAVGVLLLLFTAYDVSRRVQRSPGPAPSGSPSSPRPPLQAEPSLSGDMLAIAGNRMRQPLQAMNLFAGSLNRDALPTQRRALLGLENSMRELADVIDDVERISQLLRGEAPAAAADLAVSALFRKLQPMLGGAARGAEVDLHWLGGDLCLRSDPHLLQRLLQVLVEDAVRRARHRVVVAARPHAARVLLQVRDDGERLDLESTMPVLDQLWQRAHDADERGACLGLAFGAHIAALLDAGVTARSGHAGGNSISVDLPRVQPTATTPDDATLFSLALRESESRHGTRSPSRLAAGADAAHGGGVYPEPGTVEPGQVCAAPSSDADATRRG